MDDSLLMAVVGSVTHLGEELQALANAELLRFRKLNDVLGVDDILHGEVRHGA